MAIGNIERLLEDVDLQIDLVSPGSDSDARFRMGDGTLEISMRLHALNRARLCKAFRAIISDEDGDLIILQGGKSRCRDATDHEELFRQESFFHWCFGAKEPDLMGVIEPRTGQARLFVPRLPIEYETWMGHILTKEEWRTMYAVDEVLYVDEISSFIGMKTSLFFPKGVNTDSGVEHPVPVIEDIVSRRTEKEFLQLFELLSELRMVKTEMELDVMRYSAAVSSAAHVEIMQKIRPGMTEYQMESLFQHHCYGKGGCRYTSYTCICASGSNGATLHYGHAAAANSSTIQDGSICLFDMGTEYHCYGSDITCSFPANGNFTDDQKMIYEAVLASQRAVFEKVRPGVSWPEMHVLAERTILEKLLEGGLLVGDVDEMLEARLGAVFMPHGLGHTLGIDTHDVGGMLSGHPKRDSRPGLKSLRMTRTLRKNMVVTVEPGIYFNPALIEKAVNDPSLSKYLRTEEIDRFRTFGGVRLEDDIVITSDGYENLTRVPRNVADVEQVMAGAAWDSTP
mmetsp:Transcript_753/g.1833  ORF Transcript_753/g.1833 Transcript_753/m.1833 type:complete len:511 (-) Transcript_753:177-1709(-)|eukprot:CAMPEP_0113954044 /NCGR_PEP_ID=MMETSP0011_2-20120614/222_1 /TAXON_ID=101924 /ORGANISM="Rhodosorus marinus" /LENGTH=510 /DNA_ID=CAMNT_0000962905 /DNA_START=2616 /DNA_END=4148 /DNA_ORIENTATION=- /assembly_acc=CAM_ASM_000156